MRALARTVSRVARVAAVRPFAAARVAPAPLRLAFAPAQGLGLAAARHQTFRSSALLAAADGDAPRQADDRSSQLFVGNIPFTVDGAQLSGMFAEYGVQDAKIVYDQQSGRSKGIAFLTFSNSDQAIKAQAAMNGAVRVARDARRRAFFGHVAHSHNACRFADAAAARRRSLRAATSAWRRASRRASAAPTSRASRASSARAARRRVARCMHAMATPLVRAGPNGNTCRRRQPRSRALTRAAAIAPAATPHRRTTTASCSSATWRGRWTAWTLRTFSRNLAPSSPRRRVPPAPLRAPSWRARALPLRRTPRVRRTRAAGCPRSRAAASPNPRVARTHTDAPPHHTASSLQVITDRETGRSRGFGFVIMSTKDESAAAASELGGANIDGRKIVVEFASEKAKAE
jgi:RNA recognition motif-containing protein